MAQNLKIIKATNGNTRFVRESFNGVSVEDVTVAVLREQASLKAAKGKDQIQVRDTTNTSYEFDINTVKETQQEPASPVPFDPNTQTIEDLMTLLRTDFFF